MKTILNKIKIDKRQATSIQLQIAQSIKNLLFDQQINYMNEMPSIDDLAIYLDVAVADVKQAYHRLVVENLLHQEHGIYYANFVNLSSDFYFKMTKLYDVIKNFGLTPTIKTIKKRVTELPVNLALDPSIDPTIPYVQLKRIYYGNDIPLAIMDIYLPQESFKGIEQMNFDEKPLYEALFFTYGKLISSGRRLMSVVNLPREDAKILNSAVDTASYQVVSITFDQHKKLIDISRSISTMNQYFEVDFEEKDIQKIAKNHFFYI
jgi:DNA-binding GntR family transcriptional regulator